MKIGFDAKRITSNQTGLGNYGRYIVNILSLYFPENKYILFSPGKGKDKLVKQIRDSSSIFYRYPISSWSKSLWRQFSIVNDLKKEAIALYHGLSNELPLNIKKNHIPSIVTIHDLIFIRYPQFYKRFDRMIYSYKFRKACENATRIIAISEMTKKDIIHFFNIPTEKIDVVYQGCDPSFTHKVSPEYLNRIKKKYDLPDQFLLCVGSIEQRKNLLLILKSMKYLESDISLIAIGKRTKYTEEVEKYIIENNLQSRIKIFHQIPFEELPSFYQLATIFIYPSFFEGFGIPIIEALHSNLPVIAATGSCLEEAGGPDSLYVDPYNEKELSEKINKVLSDTSFATHMKIKGKEYTTKFDDRKIASQLVHIYSNISK